MKLTILLCAGAMMCALTACSGSKTADPATDPKPAKAVAVAADPAPDPKGVVELDNDNALRPGAKIDRPVVIDFNATWCMPCKRFKPSFDTAAARFANKATFYSVDIDRNPATAQAFGVQAVPTILILLPDGKKLTYVGTADILPTEKFIKVLADNL